MICRKKNIFLILQFFLSHVNGSQNIHHSTLEEQEYAKNDSLRVKRGAALAIALTAGSTIAGTSAMAVSQALGNLNVVELFFGKQDKVC